MKLTKVQAYGNDFLYVEGSEAGDPPWPETARAVCERHTGIGADGLIVYRRAAGGAVMRLFNADGSPSEVSGNGVRGLAALMAWHGDDGSRLPGAVQVITTDAGPKALQLLECQGSRFVFRADMGEATDIRRLGIDVGGERVEAVALRVGNPQCVVLDASLDEVRYRRLGPLIERHSAFPHRTNVEFAAVEAPSRVRILIWERGVGPTRSSGTGSCAAAVAAIRFGGASSPIDVAAPGGVQTVEWADGRLFLTGWADVVWEGRWIR